MEDLGNGDFWGNAVQLVHVVGHTHDVVEFESQFILTRKQMFQVEIELIVGIEVEFIVVALAHHAVDAARYVNEMIASHSRVYPISRSIGR